MEWINQRSDLPNFTWNSTALESDLAAVRHQQELLLGRMQTDGFDLQQEATLGALTSNVVQSSAIEREIFDVEDVRSSIARRLGLGVGGDRLESREVEGVVEMMLDTTQNYAQSLKKSRLCGWKSLTAEALSACPLSRPVPR